MMMKRIIRENRKIRNYSIFLACIYFMAYWYSLGNFIRVENSGVGIRILDGWRSLIFRSRTSFIWEPVGLIEIFNLGIVISVPNMMLGIILSLLVFLNIFMAVYLYRLPRMCKIDYKPVGIIALLPSFLTGFACCVPTFLISFGSFFGSFSAYFVRFRGIFIPLSVIFLLLGAVYSLKTIKRMTVQS